MEGLVSGYVVSGIGWQEMTSADILKCRIQWYDAWMFHHVIYHVVSIKDIRVQVFVRLHILGGMMIVFHRKINIDCHTPISGRRDIKFSP